MDNLLVTLFLLACIAATRATSTNYIRSEVEVPVALKARAEQKQGLLLPSPIVRPVIPRSLPIPSPYSSPAVFRDVRMSALQENTHADSRSYDTPSYVDEDEAIYPNYQVSRSDVAHSRSGYNYPTYNKPYGAHGHNHNHKHQHGHEHYHGHQHKHGHKHKHGHYHGHQHEHHHNHGHDHHHHHNHKHHNYHTHTSYHHHGGYAKEYQQPPYQKPSSY